MYQNLMIYSLVLHTLAFTGDVPDSYYISLLACTAHSLYSMITLVDNVGKNILGDPKKVCKFGQP